MLSDNRYFFSVKASLLIKFFCIIESSICIPTVLGSKATLTPEPKTPTDELPTHEYKRKDVKMKVVCVKSFCYFSEKVIPRLSQELKF